LDKYWNAYFLKNNQETGVREMNNHLIMKDIDEYYQVMNSELWIFEQIGSTCCYQIHPRWGKGLAERIILGNGVEINIWNMELVQDLKLVWQLEERCFEIMHCVEGHACYGGCESKNEKQIKTGEYGCWTNDGKQNWVHFSADLPWKSISICYAEGFIKSFLEMAPSLTDRQEVKSVLDYYNKGNDSCYLVSPDTELVFSEIMNCSQKGIARLLYIESKALEIFSLFIQNELLLRKHKNYKIFLSREDRLKLEQAKRIIVDNMLDPLSVAELALQIDLNVYKLKVGFKEMWGTTIFGYLRDMRMEKARFLLSGTHKNVAEVAQEVGYSNPSHFSTAFRKKYGINPHEYANHYRSL
jgi:AraC-like DNA-binding protein